MPSTSRMTSGFSMARAVSSYAIMSMLALVWRMNSVRSLPRGVEQRGAVVIGVVSTTPASLTGGHVSACVDERLRALCGL